ncbi:unnamed protein product [Calypogeia fissa]
MAEACGFCHKSFLPSKKLNESLKCACQRPFFSQVVTRNNLPTDLDCWIEVPKRFVRHYSSLFGENVNFEGDDGRSHACTLVGSAIAIVGYGFEWYNFANSHNVGMGDQIVFTLMSKSRFLLQVYKENPHAVKVEEDADVQVAGPQDWWLAKARKSGNITVKVEPDVEEVPADVHRVTWKASGAPEVNDQILAVDKDGVPLKATGAQDINDQIDDLPADVDRAPLKATGAPEINDEVGGKTPSLEKTDGQSVQAKAPSEDATGDGAKGEDARGEGVELEVADSDDGEASSSSTSDSEWSLRGSKRKMIGTRKGSGQKESIVEAEESSGATTSDEAKGSGKGSSPLLYIPKPRKSPDHWATPGTTSVERMCQNGVL